jgi:RecA-family ATPase
MTFLNEIVTVVFVVIMLSLAFCWFVVLSKKHSKNPDLDAHFERLDHELERRKVWKKAEQEREQQKKQKHRSIYDPQEPSW